VLVGARAQGCMYEQVRVGEIVRIRAHAVAREYVIGRGPGEGKVARGGGGRARQGRERAGETLYQPVIISSQLRTSSCGRT